MTRRIPLYIFGASGHAKVVAEAARRGGEFDLRGFLDDDANKWKQSFCGLPILGGIDALRELPSEVQVALGIGSNRARRDVVHRLVERGARLASVIHPSAVVSEQVEVGAGSLVAPLAVLHPDSVLGRGCIVNTAAVVEHDARIGDWVHLSPNAVLAGNVRVGEGTQIGLGACVLPNTQIGSWSMIGAGAVVIGPIPDSVTAVGVPARVIGPARSG